ncbi:hypothetical protein [Streptomyces sp. Ac-502]|uniref:hypothetical protein n=1 Tax=Streptomyces sp. Ac-502 TaxID=3342801 RepID=UPI003862956F
MVEARLRLPLGSLGLTAPHAVGKLLRDSAVPGFPAALTAVGGAFAVRMNGDGQWLEALAHVPRDALETGLAPIAAVVAAVAADGPGPVADRENGMAEYPADAGQLMEQALWRGAREPDGQRQTTGPSVQGGCLAIVGALPADAALSLVKQVLPAAAHVTGGTAGCGEIPWKCGELTHVEQQPGSAEAGFLLCSPETPACDDEAARYLTTALFGGYYGSRLATALGRLGTPITELLVGRDRFVGQPRAWIRARAAVADTARLLDTVCREADRLAHEPTGAVELAQVAEFCAAQMTSVFDSPAALADGLARFGALGWSPESVTTFPDRLGAVTAGQVTQTAAQLFQHELRGGVLMGDPATREALHSVWARWGR